MPVKSLILWAMLAALESLEGKESWGSELSSVFFTAISSKLWQYITYWAEWKEGALLLASTTELHPLPTQEQSIFHAFFPEDISPPPPYPASCIFFKVVFILPEYWKFQLNSGCHLHWKVKNHVHCCKFSATTKLWKFSETMKGISQPYGCIKPISGSFNFSQQVSPLPMWSE